MRKHEYMISIIFILFYHNDLRVVAPEQKITYRGVDPRNPTRGLVIWV
jgi:hypothetical protein